MPLSLNKVLLVGNLGRDPEIRYTASQMAIANLSVATTERRKKGDSWEDETQWHRVVAFGKTAEFLSEYATKGSTVVVEGRITYGSYEKDGEKRYTTEIVAEKVGLGGGKAAPERGRQPQGRQQDFHADDIPF